MPGSWLTAKIGIIPCDDAAQLVSAIPFRHRLLNFLVQPPRRGECDAQLSSEGQRGDQIDGPKTRPAKARWTGGRPSPPSHSFAYGIACIRAAQCEADLGDEWSTVLDAHSSRTQNSVAIAAPPRRSDMTIFYHMKPLLPFENRHGILGGPSPPGRRFILISSNFPPLTTVDDRADQCAYLAVELIMGGLGSTLPLVQLTVPTSLIVRETCGCLLQAVVKT